MQHYNHNHNPNRNPTTIRYAVVSIQLNIVTCSRHIQKVTWDNAVAPFLQLSVVIVTHPYCPASRIISRPTSVRDN